MSRGSNRSGFTLVEALVALALFAIVAAAALGLQAQALRATRTAEARRAVAAVLRAEVALQRALGGVPGACSGAVPAGWTCQVQRACVAQAGASCDLRIVTVRMTDDDGGSGGASGTAPPRALTATTAVYALSGSEARSQPLTEPRSRPLTEPRSQPLTEPRSQALSEPRSQPRSQPLSQPLSEAPSEAPSDARAHVGRGFVR